MAETPILMPQLGESVTEGTIAKWFKKPGDRVEKYEALAEVITDKVNAEVPSPVSGVVTAITAPEGATVGVKQEICRIDESGDGAAGATDGSVDGAPDGAPGKPPSASAPSSAAAGPPTGTRAANTTGTPEAPWRAIPAGGHYSPAVRKLAQEHRLDLSAIRGTGMEGRVTRKDVLNFIQGPRGAAPSTTAPAAAVSVPAVPAPPAAAPTAPTAPAAAAQAGTRPDALLQAEENGDQVITPDPIRRRIAERMVQAVREAPHAWSMIEVDVTNLVRLRERQKDEFQRRNGVNLTYLPFVIQAAVEGVKEFPLVNSAWINDKIVVRRRVSIGLAVATDDALMVPVIKDADQKSIAGLAHAITDLAARARAGKLTLDDISGGTFTVDNTGSFGSVASMPIINPPQAAILTFEAIVSRPVVRDDAIAIRQMVNLCLSIDHRVLDGLVAGRFLQAVRQRLENLSPDTPLY